MTPFYVPYKPSSFVCQPASALIITKGGEVEIISSDCSMPIATFPKFAGTGRTASWVNEDEELILLGNDDLGIGGRYITIQKPRDGLLAMKYKITDLPLSQVPHRHVSLVSKNTLYVLGGKFKSTGKFSNSIWTELSLKWDNGSRFRPDFTSSCTVKLGPDVHFIFGGEGRRQVVKINTTEETAVEMLPLVHKRVFHDCQLLDSSLVLVSGGLPRKEADPSEVLPDELYNITSQQVVKVLDLQQSLGRIQHATINIRDRVWAVGGRDSNNNAPSKIAEFNPTTNSWDETAQELHSTDTTELVITPFPIASLDCVAQCGCGIANRKERIFGGSEVQVRSII